LSNKFFLDSSDIPVREDIPAKLIMVINSVCRNKFLNNKFFLDSSDIPVKEDITAKLILVINSVCISK